MPIEGNVSFTCSCGFSVALYSFVKATGGSLIEFPQLIRRENTRTHKSKSTTVVVYAARAMEIAPVHSSGSHEGACSGCSKEAPRKTNVARVGCLCAKAPSLATAARKETLRPKQPARVVDCYKEITLTVVMLSFACYFERFRVTCF